MPLKAGIISLDINTEDLNHGAMLHSWAFQTYLRTRLGIASEIIDYVTPRAFGMDLSRPVWCHLKNGKFKPALVAALGAAAYSRRFRKFRNFIRRDFVVSPRKYSLESLSSASLDYDLLFCESDVIWDPVFFQGKLDPAFFLALPSMQSARRIAYSPSMGNMDVSPDAERQLESLLGHLDAISCRETYAADYISARFGKNAVAVVDPVLLLEGKDFLPIAAPRLVREPYLFFYTPVGYDLKLNREAARFAARNGLRLVEVSRYSWNSLFHRTVADAGIEEFLSLLLHADAVFTNSFHGLCFSLLFHKPFYAFPRKTGRKIEDICRRVGLPERFLAHGFHPLPPVDWDTVDRRIDSLRKASETWLANAIGPMENAR